MSVNMVPENDLHAALRAYRVDPDKFRDAVFEKLSAAERQLADEPFVRLSPLLQAASAYLPLAVLAGCKATPAASKLVPATAGYKLLSYLAFPAISLFVLLGATIFSIARIRSIRETSGPELEEQDARREAISQWWHRHKWGARTVFAVTLIAPMVGAAGLMFLVYIISFGLLIHVLTTFAKLGLGNRETIGRFTSMGLMFLGQTAMMAGIGYQEIHFVDQKLVGAVFIAGALILMWIAGISRPSGLKGTKLTSRIAQRNAASCRPVAFEQRQAEIILQMQRNAVFCRTVAGFLALLLIISGFAFLMHPILWPATLPRIKRYVESFDHARFSTVSWQHWEIAARWVIDSKLDPDLSKPRRLLAEELSGEQNPFILGTAFRVGLVRIDQLGLLNEYKKRRVHLFNDPKASPLLSIDQQDWIIRAAVLHHDLSAEQRDYLEQRLNATLEHVLNFLPIGVLDDSLRVTQLLEAIDRPVNRERYRSRIHNLLREFHSKGTGGFAKAGGFKEYRARPSKSWFGQPGSLTATASAVELMEIYGVPDDLDLNWVRSFLQPSIYNFGSRKWMAAATLDRLNHLPGVTRPTWLEILYYERSQLAALILVGLCIYATLSAPHAKAVQGA